MTAPRRSVVPRIRAVSERWATCGTRWLITAIAAARAAAGFESRAPGVAETIPSRVMARIASASTSLRLLQHCGRSRQRRPLIGTG